MDVSLDGTSSTAAQTESYLDDDCPTPTLDEHLLDGSESQDGVINDTATTDSGGIILSTVKDVLAGSSKKDLSPSELAGDDHEKHGEAVIKTDRDREILFSDGCSERGINEVSKPSVSDSDGRSGQMSEADVKSGSEDEKKIENKEYNSEKHDPKPKEPNPSKPTEVANMSIHANSNQSVDSVLENKMNLSLMKTSENLTNSRTLHTDETSETKTNNLDVFINKCSSITKESSVCDTTISGNDFRCKKCLFVTRDENLYKTHTCLSSSNVNEDPKGKQITIAFDNGSFFCSACEFKSKAHSFEEHLMCHLNVKPYQCIYCPEAFVNRRQMSVHVSVSHTGKKMNCALKALSKAKKLMEEAQKNNSFIFTARVPGKVPLQIDPYGNIKAVKEKAEMSKEKSEMSKEKAEMSKEKPEMSKEKSEISKSDHNSGSVLPGLQSTNPERDDGHDASNETKDAHVEIDENNSSKDAVKSDTAIVTFKNQESVADNAASCPVLDMSNQVHKEHNNASVDDKCKHANRDGKQGVETSDSNIILTSGVSENAANNDSKEFECVEDGKLNKDPVDLERKDKNTDASQSVDILTPDNVDPSEEKEVGTTDDVDGSSENYQQQADKEIHFVDSNKTIVTSSDKEASSENDSRSVCVDSPNPVVPDGKETPDNDSENTASKITDVVSEKDSNKELDSSEGLSNGSDTRKDQCRNLLSQVIKETSEISKSLEQVNNDGEMANISSSIEDDIVPKTSAEPEIILLDADDKHVTSSDGVQVSDALKADDANENDSEMSDVNVLQQEQDSNIQGMEEHENKLHDSSSPCLSVLQEEHDSNVQIEDHQKLQDASSDSQKDTSGIQITEDSTGQIDANHTDIHGDRSEELELETVDNCPEIDNENKDDNLSSDVDEGQELKIIDSFSLHKDDHSFSTETDGNKFTSEETAVIDEVCVKQVEEHSIHSTSDDDDVDESSEKSNAEKRVSFVDMVTMNADDDGKTSSVKSSDEAQAIPFSTVEKSETPPQAPPKPLTVQREIKHMRNPNFYICGLGCPFSCLNSVEFRDHLVLEHAGEAKFPCYYCGYVAQSEDGVLKHMINHAHTYNKAAPLYYCGVERCKFGTNLLTDFLNHMQIMHSNSSTFTCKECDHIADSIENLVKHFDENYLHVVTCPHCTSKGSDRSVILRHIAQCHPGKAKMVQVAKQMICKERKQNNFYQNQNSNVKPESKPMPLAVTEIKLEQSSGFPEGYVEKFSPKLKMKKGETIDRHIDPPKCDHCTFVARDTRRLQSHLNCHGQPQKVKRHRFRCIYCPQAFDASAKFKSHIACHPGLIKYWIYCCRRCDFDTNQRHVILRHVNTNDELHSHTGEDEDMFSVVERIMESRVLECDRCNFQTRHKLHLQIHYERDHQIIKAIAQAPTDRESSPPGSSLSVSLKSPTIQVPEYKRPSRNISLTAVSSGQVQENRLKKFKCPHCQYLVPKAADLKQHVKRHDYLGKISLHIFRCKYCSSSSTARDLVFEHIREKHPGKALQLVRKTVDIDTKGTENTFSETSVAEAPISSSDYNPHIPAINPMMPISTSNPVIDRFHCETCAFSTPSREAFDSHLQLHNTKGGIQGMSQPEDDSEDEDAPFTEMKPSPDSSDAPMEAVPFVDVEKIIQVVIVPECVATDTLTAAARCPQCYFASGYRSAFVSHVKSLHPDVVVVMRNNNQVQEVTESGTIGKAFYLPDDLSPEVLVIPEKQVFSQAVGCPKCPNFATYFRRNLVLHIQKHHSEVTAMGLSSWRGWRQDTGTDSKTGAMSSGQATEVQDESCIIGSGNLDEKIAILYENYGAKHKCLICTIEKSKKYFMHIHILRHLDISLWKCAYCSYRGLEKHKVKQHLKEHHPEKPFSVVYVKVDIDSKVSDFLKQLSLNRNIPSLLSPSEKASTPPVAAAAAAACSSVTTPTSQDSKIKSTCPLGTTDLDDKVCCLYETVNNKFRCILCSCEFSRKFAIHRHLVTNHLKVALIGCGYCDFTGVDKHYITDHILMQHPKAPIKVVNLDIDIPQKVTELLSSPNPGKRSEGSYKSQQTIESAPRAYYLGKDLLDQKLQCLYKRQPNGFRCRMCDWKFPRKYACHRHIFVKHLKTYLFGCAYCHAKAVERYLIISHIKEAHPGSPPHAQILKVDIDKKISECLSGISQGSEDMAYMQHNSDSQPAPPEEFLPEQKPDIGDVKPADTGMVVALFGRKRKDSDPVFPPVLSPVSPKKLKTTCRMTDVTTNIKVICVAEGSIKKYVCEVCRFTSLHRSNVYRHVLRVHEKYREQECKFCNYKTLSVVLMRQHTEIEHESELQPKKQPEDDNMPVVKVKQERTDDEPQPEPKTESDHKENAPTDEKSSALQHTIKTYCCAYCDYETHTSENILKHTKELHCQKPDASVPSSSTSSSTTTTTTTTTTPTSDSSSTSGYRPVLKTNIKKGKFSANQYLNCGYCSFRSASLPDIKAHAKFEHRSETAVILSPYSWRYICKVCSLKNSAAGKMRNHINRHIEYRPYTCGSCGTSYSSSDELRKHIKNYLHADDIMYIKNDKKEKKVNHLIQESRRCAEMVNLGTPFQFDSDLPAASDLQDTDVSSGKEMKTLKRRYSKPSIKKITSTWKTESLGSIVKFKFVKKKATAQKTKFRYAQNCPFAKKVPIRVHPRKDASLINKDSFGCSRCSFSNLVSIERVRQHHREAHPDHEFLWLDKKLQLTCRESGDIVECPSRMRMPPADEQFTHKQLSSKSTKFYCNGCDFSCWVLQAMKSHIRIHQPRRFLCPYCQTRYHKRDNLEKHLFALHSALPAWKVHLQETPSTRYIESPDHDEDEAASSVTPGSSIAPGKQKKKKLKSKLLGPKTKRHQRIMAEYKEWRAHGQPVRRSSQSINYCCHHCSFTSESLYLFRLHLANHGSYPHLVSDLTSESPLKCGFCPYVAGDETDFSIHMETHFDMRNYRCGHCSYSAYTKAHVRSHLANFHAGLEEKMIDTSSLALAENRSEEATKMPKLVNLDPQVLLEDIQYLTDQDLTKLMPLKSGVLQFDFTVKPTQEDLLLDGENSDQNVDDMRVDAESGLELSEGVEQSSKRRKLSAENDFVSVTDSVSVRLEKIHQKISENFLKFSESSDSERNTRVSKSLQSQDEVEEENQPEVDCLGISQGFLIGNIAKGKESDDHNDQGMVRKPFPSADNGSDSLSRSQSELEDEDGEGKALIGDDELMQEGTVLDDMDNLMEDTTVTVGLDMEEATDKEGVVGSEMDELTHEQGVTGGEMGELTRGKGVMGGEMNKDMDEFTEQRGVMGDEVDGQVESGSAQSESERPCSSVCEDHGNVFNTLNSWLSSA